jgi:hypothetical protein
MHGCGCHAWQPQMPRQTARPQARRPRGRRPPRWSSCYQAGPTFIPAGFFTIAAGAPENPLGNCFSPTPRGGFCMPRAGSSFAASTKAVPTAPA